MHPKKVSWYKVVPAACTLQPRNPGSVAGDDGATPVEAVVDTDPDEIVRQLDKARCEKGGSVGENSRGCQCRMRLRPEVGVQIFDLDRSVIPECV